MAKRDRWGSKLGIILAVAGSAVGLGNFIRFPNVVASNGGGAFMIPYFLAFLIIGIPLAWIEWTLGRWGGQYGVNSGPAIFHLLSGKKHWKFLGLFNVLAPLLIIFYYVVIESVILGYAFYSLTGRLTGLEDGQVGVFLEDYISGGAIHGQEFTSFLIPLVFFLITFAINYYVIYHGISGGIEKVSLYGMPLLGVCALILLVRVLTLGMTEQNLEASLADGFNFFWDPDFSVLFSAKVWLEAAGQIFFSLSLGLGAIMCYASYLRKNDDVALSSLTANSTNTFAEVIVGGSIIVPAAVMFFGIAQAQEYAGAGTFTLGFVVMPQIFNAMAAGGQFFAFLWFGLLFIAGVTSSVSLIQPSVAFLQNEFSMPRTRAISIIGGMNFLVGLFVLFGFAGGAVDELDFWAANFGAPVSALIMVILFSHVIGVEKGYLELSRGAKIPVPPLFQFLAKYVTPTFLALILGSWFLQEGWKVIALLEPKGELKWVIPARMIVLLAAGAILYLSSIGRDSHELDEVEPSTNMTK